MHMIFCTVSNYVLAAGKRNPRNPTTKRSPRAPKLKEAEIGEGSFPGTARQLEYAPRVEPVIKISTKKAFIQPPVFGDTEASIGSKVMLPQWGDLFNRINREEYQECIPHNNPDVRALDDQVFPNIQRSCLHMEACRTLVFPCIQVLNWLIDHTEVQKCLINDENGGCVRVFLPTEVQKDYKLKDPEEWLNTNFVVKFYEFHDTNRLMASWWKEEKKFTNWSNGWYGTVNLRETYIYLMALICRLYGEKECSKFSEAWMPLAYTVAISGSSFN
jgi:hypothetical protein